MYKFYFLINPVSGGGQGKQIYEFLPEIMRSMDFADDDWHAEFTTKDGTREQIANALSKTESLVAVGGDGTVSAVFSEMMHHPRRFEAKIGLIPLGTGNDLARVLGLYKPFVDKGLLYLVRRLILAPARSFDIWNVNGKVAFANYFSAGIDARIAHDFNAERSSGKIKSNSVVVNKAHYVKSFFKDRNYCLKSGSITFVDQNGAPRSIDLANHRTVIIGNIPSFASGSNPFYKSNSSDGLLEVVCVPNMAFFLLSIAVGTVPLVGYIFKKYFLKSFKARSIKLSLAEDEFLQVDGEDATGTFGTDIDVEYGFSVRILSLQE